MGVSSLTLSPSSLALGLKHDSVVERHLLYLKPALPSGWWCILLETSMFVLNYSYENFYGRLFSSPIHLSQSQSSRRIHSLIHSGTILDISEHTVIAWTDTILPSQTNYCEQVLWWDVHDIMGTQRTGTYPCISVVKERFSEERYGLKAKTKRSRHQAGKRAEGMGVEGGRGNPRQKEYLVQSPRD